MAIFCSFLISCFPGMLLQYCLGDFEMIPVTPVITSIAFPFTFHHHHHHYISSSSSSSSSSIKNLRHYRYCL